MESADYYTIMESKIKYYAGKYDPDSQYSLTDISPVVAEKPKDKKSPSEKIISGFGYIFSFLF
jgi:hypothetical protein